MNAYNRNEKIPFFKGLVFNYKLDPDTDLMVPDGIKTEALYVGAILVFLIVALI